MTRCSADGSAPALGAGCREFESRHLDQSFNKDDLILVSLTELAYVAVSKTAGFGLAGSSPARDTNAPLV